LDLGPIRANVAMRSVFLTVARIMKGAEIQDPNCSSRSVFMLPGLLRFELVQLPFLPVDFSLLRRYTPLQFFVLLLPGLHLVTDHGSAE
jgi:hypothetical protein